MDALTFDNVPEARYVLTYQQRNITRDIAKDLTSLTYSDRLSGESDDMDIELQDTEGKWNGPWYPGHGDSLTLGFGWLGKAIRTIGRFEIDEIEPSGPPSSVSIRALATGINTPVRTIEHQAYENTRLDQVAQQIAQRQGLTLVGSIEPIALDRLTQQESDLEFLRNLADQYDYAFKVTGDRLVFHRISELAKAAPVATFTLKQLEDYRIRDQIRAVPAKVSVKHHDPATKKMVSYDLQNGEVVAVASSASKTTTSADTHKKRKRAVSASEAKAQAKAEQAKANRARTSGSITLMGAPMLVSGNVIALTDAGKLTGHYLVTAARHTFTRSGYRSALEVCRVLAPLIALTQNPTKPDLALSTYGIQSKGAVA